MEIDLYKATTKELTGSNVPTVDEAFDAVLEKGYDYCPAEIGPQLRIQYTDQPHKDTLRIVMEPILDSIDGYPLIFVLDHFNWKPYIYGDHELCGNELRGFRCLGGTGWVFIRRKF